jgi:phosphorylcholine metabolism protein LicD
MRLNSELIERFPDSRLKGKNECERGRIVMVRMFRIFSYLCKKHNIDWFLAGGSMLGAIRSGEMFPWSKDIDVVMTDRNIKLFEKLCVPELSPDIFYQSHKTELNYSNRSQRRLRDRHSNYYQWQAKNPNNRFHNGLMIDIFIVTEGKTSWSSLGQFKEKEYFPLIKVTFESMEVYLPKNYIKLCEILYGEAFMDFSKSIRKDYWKATEPCVHKESLPFPIPVTHTHKKQEIYQNKLSYLKLFLSFFGYR